RVRDPGWNVTRREWFMTAMTGALREQRVLQAAQLIAQATASSDVRAAVLDVRQGKFSFSRAFGEARSRDTVFLLASISKPMAAAGVMLLADRGELALNDPVHKFIPEFSGA